MQGFQLFVKGILFQFARFLILAFVLEWHPLLNANCNPRTTTLLEGLPCPLSADESQQQNKQRKHWRLQAIPTRPFPASTFHWEARVARIAGHVRTPRQWETSSGTVV